MGLFLVFWVFVRKLFLSLSWRLRWKAAGAEEKTSARSGKTSVRLPKGDRLFWGGPPSLDRICEYSFLNLRILGSLMKRINMILWALCGIILRVQAEVQGAADISGLLDELDKAITEKAVYQKQKEDSARVLRMRLLHASDDRERYALSNSLFEIYLHNQADSALFYIGKKSEFMQSLGDLSLENEVLVNRAEVMGVMGMYNEALDALLKVNPERMDKKQLCYYYQTYRACYGWLADYTFDEDEKQKYFLQADIYRDSAIAVMPQGPERRLMEVEVLLRRNKAEESLAVLDSLDGYTPDDKYLAYVNFTKFLAWDMLQNRDEAIRCLAKTALVDLKGGVREYASLPQLARQVYETGDLDRAYRYLKCSMEDAVACNARLRFMEVTEVYPIIDKAYMEKEAQERKASRILFWCVSAMAVLLVVLALYLYYGLKKLSLMRRHLFAANRELRAMNGKLVQTGKIKEVYIARYLDRCVGYLDKQEQYRRSLEKLAMASKLEELFKAIRSEQFLKDERKSFYNEFDRSFLDLFPNFVADFNDLLVEEGRIFPKPGEILNTELRIFALIRLGVTDTARIAHFLGYSLATVYNYRSKLRNKAKGDKEDFERAVMNL